MLNKTEIERYSRQLLLPCIGVQGQEKICSTSVIVIGAGGIGSSVILYLAAAGIHKLGIVDYDVVERSNLQRQIIHSEETLGIPKVESAAKAVQKLSSLVSCQTFNTLIDRSNALDILQGYDILVDATDNVATRYLLNDASVFLHKPLVSGSALRMDGQLTVYNYQGGPCYRCLFPTPPPPETVTNCNEGGVLGVVPGLIGCLQALEVIKIASGMNPSYNQKLLLMDAESGSFRSVKIRGKDPKCAVCGPNATIKELIDYVQFCGSSADDKAESITVLQDHERITVETYADIRSSKQQHILIDVREKLQYDICSLPDTFHFPWSTFKSNLQVVGAIAKNEDVSIPVYVICRRGNDSQLAVKLLKEELGMKEVFDVKGGFVEWSKRVDPEFPIY